MTFKATERSAVVLAAAGIVGVALAAYANSFAGPFVFDDRPAIVDNLTLRHWWPPWPMLAPPAEGASVCGRPLLNVSFAVNYAWGGLGVTGYHVVNLVLHTWAGLLLFGVVRRTVRRPAVRGWVGEDGLGVSAAIAALWVAHPLLTESVTYIVNRSEVLAGVLFLLTLYAFIRAVEGRAQDGNGRNAEHAGWQVTAFVACLLGMASKEWMAAAPLIVLLYDRTFVAGSFRDAWRRRRRIHLGLAATWILLAVLMIGSRQRNGVAGFGLGVSSWTYALTQAQAIVRYLRLSLWPDALVFDYGNYLVRDAAAAALPGLGVVTLVAATVVALWRKPVLGFIGGWFFAILAPSSSVVPLVSQTVAEQRMYLPLAAVIGPGVVGLYRWLGRRSLAVFLALVVGWIWLTARRNEVYRDETALWRDVIAKWPGNARAHDNLGLLLARQPGRLDDAIAEYRSALRLDPVFTRAHFNLALALAQMPGRLNDAIAEYQAALQVEPDLAEAHNGLGAAWSQTAGRGNDAIAEYQTALRLKPDYPEAHNNLGLVWWTQPGRLNDAIAEFKSALRLNPDYAEAHNNLGNALSRSTGRLDDAIAEYEAALRLRPDYAEAHNGLGSAWTRLPGRLNDAISQFQEAVRLKPDYAEAHNNLGSAWSQTPGRLNEAVAEYQTAVRLKPDFAEAHYNLGLALARIPGRLRDAVGEFQTAVRLRADLAPAWHSLGLSLVQSGDLRGAAAAFREEVRLAPNDAAARQALESVLQSLGSNSGAGSRP